jgi:hypothetical protein
MPKVDTEVKSKKLKKIKEKRKKKILNYEYVF